MEDQIILIDKPTDISSFGAVAKVRRELTQKFGRKIKVGHTGTLDPFATGLLILLSGKMTKKSHKFLKLDKVYEATLKLGYTSTTGDPEGEIFKYDPKQAQISSTKGPSGVISENGNASPVTTNRNDQCPKPNDVELVLKQFIGKIKQTPPRFSAIKINGQRAYKLARAGKDFEIPTREIEIYSLEILNYTYPELKIRAHCSSGTYIRTLAEDIGKALNAGAYLTALRRTKIGEYSVTHAKKLVL